MEFIVRFFKTEIINDDLRAKIDSYGTDGPKPKKM